MKNLKLRLAFLYPQLATAAADRGNLAILRQRCHWRGIETEVDLIKRQQDTDLSSYDLILLPDCPHALKANLAYDLHTHRSSLQAAIDLNSVLFAVGTGYQLLGNALRLDHDTEVSGLALLDFHSSPIQEPFIGLTLLRCDFPETGIRSLVGYKRQYDKTVFNSEYTPLGELLHGIGNHTGTDREGVTLGNIFATYLQGPLLAYNAWFADLLIERALKRSTPDVFLEPLDDDTQEEAVHHLAIQQIVAAKNKPSWLSFLPFTGSR